MNDERGTLNEGGFAAFSVHTSAFKLRRGTLTTGRVSACSECVVKDQPRVGTGVFVIVPDVASMVKGFVCATKPGTSLGCRPAENFTQLLAPSSLDKIISLATEAHFVLRF